jgi:hypothetical protein
MEEGPEPQEMIERTVEHKHHEHEHAHEPEPQRRAMTISAITAAVLAVCAAVGSLLSGHAANQAILEQSQATDQWAFYQAKSTKQHIYEGNKAVVASLAKLQGIHQVRLEEQLAVFQHEVERYESEKAKLLQEAKDKENHSKHEFHKHQHFALGVAGFQVGIVLASISILVRSRWLYIGSLVAGGVGGILVLIGLFVVVPEHEEAAPQNTAQRDGAKQGPSITTQARKRCTPLRQSRQCDQRFAVAEAALPATGKTNATGASEPRL